MKITWKDVLEREELIGGDLESVEDGITYRGPLAKIEERDDLIYFTSPWYARTNGSEWERSDIKTTIVNKTIVPEDIGAGRIYFSVPLLGPCTIFPKGGSKLDSSEVKGLALASERLLALYPNLSFDREEAEAVLAKLSFIHQGEALRQLPTSATLNDLLTKFRNDGSKEEFLWSYIEAVTGEKNVHQKVY